MIIRVIIIVIYNDDVDDVDNDDLDDEITSNVHGITMTVDD